MPSIVESYARNITIPAARSQPKTGDRCNHDNTSKHLTAPDPTTKVAPDQHHRRGGAPPSCRSPVSRTLQPTAARPQPSHSRPRPANTGHSQPWPATAAADQLQPATPMAKNTPSKCFAAVGRQGLLFEIMPAFLLVGRRNGTPMVSSRHIDLGSFWLAGR